MVTGQDTRLRISYVLNKMLTGGWVVHESTCVYRPAMGVWICRSHPKRLERTDTGEVRIHRCPPIFGILILWAVRCVVDYDQFSVHDALRHHT